jgi:hypothetical protein
MVLRIVRVYWKEEFDDKTMDIHCTPKVAQELLV